MEQARDEIFAIADAIERGDLEAALALLGPDQPENLED